MEDSKSFVEISPLLLCVNVKDLTWLKVIFHIETHKNITDFSFTPIDFLVTEPSWMQLHAPWAPNEYFVGSFSLHRSRNIYLKWDERIIGWLYSYLIQLVLPLIHLPLDNTFLPRPISDLSDTQWSNKDNKNMSCILHNSLLLHIMETSNTTKTSDAILYLDARKSFERLMLQYLSVV